VVNQSKSGQGVGSAGRLPRTLAWLAAGAVLAVAVLAVLDTQKARRHSLAEGDAAMLDLARVADALWDADEARIHALMARLRVELRGDPSWNAAGSAGGATEQGSARRRIDTLLRRALEGAPDLRSIELVVAGQDGLTALRIESGAEPGAAEDVVAQRETSARALWYSSEVEAAVEANGRRLARGPVVFADRAKGELPSVVAALAVHDPEDLVQGALVATIDLAPLAGRLASLSSDATRFTLATRDGIAIGRSPHPPRGDLAALIASPERANAPPDGVIEAGGRRSLIVPAADEVESELVFWLDRAEPPSFASALGSSPWVVALGALALLVVALLAWSRSAGAAGTDAESGARSAARRAARVRSESSRDVEAGSESGTRPAAVNPFAAHAPDAPAAAAASASNATPSAPHVARERFVLRDWLADVRGCLEREAATRGLTLDLRCERSLPREILQDPLWLGGLLVSLGREALDATSASRVALEVVADADAALRFELDAGETDLEAATGMRVIAGRLGAEIEDRGRGRLAVRVPGALA